MRTLGSALDEQGGFAQGFDFLRIFLAAGIIGWHTAWLSGHAETAKASAFWFSQYMLVALHSDFDRLGPAIRLAPAGVSDQ